MITSNAAASSSGRISPNRRDGRERNRSEPVAASDHNDDSNDDSSSSSDGEEAGLVVNETAVVHNTVDWSHAHRLDWSNLVDPAKKPAVDEESFDFNDWDATYTVLINRQEVENREHLLKLIFQHFTFLPSSRKCVGFGHSFKHFLRAVEHFDDQLTPQYPNSTVEAAGGALAVTAREGWTKLNSVPKKVAFMKEIERRLYPGCTSWHAFHDRVRSDLTSVHGVVHDATSAAHRVLGSTTSESGTAESNRWALLAHCALDPEGCELLETAETGVLPSRRVSSGIGRRVGIIDDMNLQGGPNAIKKKAQSDLVTFLDAFKSGLHNQYKETCFVWSNDVSDTEHRLDRPLKEIYPNLGTFRDGAEVTATFTKMRNERARVEKNYDRSGTHCTGPDLNNIIAAFCMRGGGTVLDAKLLYTVLLWKNKEIGNTASSLPDSMGAQLGTATISNRSLSNTNTNSSSSSSAGSGQRFTHNNNNNSSGNGISNGNSSSSLSTPSSLSVTPSTNNNTSNNTSNAAASSVGVHASDSVISNASKRNSNKRTLTEATASLGECAATMRSLLNDLKGGGEGSGSSGNRSTGENSSEHAQMDHIVHTLVNNRVINVGDLVREARLSVAALDALTVTTGLQASDGVEHLVSVVLECGVLRKSNLKMAAALGINLRDCSFIADYLYYLDT